MDDCLARLVVVVLLIERNRGEARVNRVLRVIDELRLRERLDGPARHHISPLHLHPRADPLVQLLGKLRGLLLERPAQLPHDGVDPNASQVGPDVLDHLRAAPRKVLGQHLGLLGADKEVLSEIGRRPGVAPHQVEESLDDAVVQLLQPVRDVADLRRVVAIQGVLSVEHEVVQAGVFFPIRPRGGRALGELLQVEDVEFLEWK